MNKIDISYGEYAAKWGLTDFYEESEAKLRDVLASDEDFEISYGCKKEIRSAKITREDDSICITVIAHMDDLWEQDDLIYDALWHRCKVDEELSDDVIESIRDCAIYDGLEDYTEVCAECPRNADFDEVCSVIASLEVEAEQGNDDMFNALCNIVEEYYNESKS